MKFQATLHTDGNGLWSGKNKMVQIHKLELGYTCTDLGHEFGELRVYFTKKSWNPEKDGLIYTDPKFMTELRKALVDAGFTKAAAKDVSYSEQGMQGDDYVSCDVTKPFLNSWFSLNQ